MANTDSGASKQFEEFFLCQRIVFVIMASGTSDGQAQPGRTDRFQPVNDVLDAKLFCNRSPLPVGPIVSQKTGGQLLLGLAVGE